MWRTIVFACGRQSREEKRVNAEMKASTWRANPRWILAATVWSTFLFSFSVADAHSASGATLDAAKATTQSTNGGLLIGLGAGVLVIGGVGFVVLSYSRKKRQPSQCSEQRDALAAAERAIQYWEGALAHIQSVDRDRFTSRATNGADGVAQLNDASPDVDHESLRTKSQNGYAEAVKYRDQCQLDLINCMASGGLKAAPLGQLLPQQPFNP
jgi:hypothetical protein